MNQWDVRFDPYGFVEREDWIDVAEEVEDILQLQHVYKDGPIIDVGYYTDLFRIYVIEGQDWEHPIEVITIEDISEVSAVVYHLMDKYENGLD